MIKQQPCSITVPHHARPHTLRGAACARVWGHVLHITIYVSHARPVLWAAAHTRHDSQHGFTPQGIDLKAGGRNKKVHRTAPKSNDPYLALLVKV